MSLHILGGKAKGLSLAVPPEDITRPTAVLLRRSLFDWRQHWEARIFVDVCAGSGVMGFEALSRGADKVILNDSHKAVARVLEKNAERWRTVVGLEEEQQLQLAQQDAIRFLERLRREQSAQEAERTVLYFDPPYEDHRLYQAFWQVIASYPGEVWVESEKKKGPALEEQKAYLKEVTKEVHQGTRWVLVGVPR